jgi:hypothetical protein
MYINSEVEPSRFVQAVVARKVVQKSSEHRFCPSMFCFTDEIMVRRIATKADVWLLTDEREDHSWLIMGSEPVCPHCGTVLL